MTQVEKAPAPESISDDLMRGVEAIARFTGWTERQVYHAVSRGHLPGAFKVGNAWCARRSTILEGLRRLEQGGA